MYRMRYAGAERAYDWCFSSGTRRTREEYPYGYDAHFLWRNFGKKKPPEGLSSTYSDRMQEWDPERYNAAQTLTNFTLQNANEEQCKRFIEYYSDGKQACVGYGLCCNVSSGYPIGIFFTVPK